MLWYSTDCTLENTTFLGQNFSRYIRKNAQHPFSQELIRKHLQLSKQIPISQVLWILFQNLASCTWQQISTSSFPPFFLHSIKTTTKTSKQTKTFIVSTARNKLILSDLALFHFRSNWRLNYKFNWLSYGLTEQM